MKATTVSAIALAVGQIWLATVTSTRSDQSQVQGLPARVIEFDPTIPVAKRLRPDDSVVVIKMLSGPPLIGQRAPESFTQEIERLANRDAIAVVDIINTEGVWVDDGTWLRTQVTGTVNQLIKWDGSTEQRPTRIEFWHHNGETILKGVRVIAGSYLEFERGRRYLVFLYQARPWGLTVVQAYALGTDGRLERIRYSSGAFDSNASTLTGREFNQVVDALTRAK